MTRFIITLDQASAFVLKAMNETLGGEIFIPKIPSVRITDLATAMAPNCRQEVVGIRPGEKVHELMIGTDDSRNTLETDSGYVLLPQKAFEQRNGNYANARPCVNEFEYSSGTNSHFLTVEEIRNLLPSIEKKTENLRMPVWSEAPSSVYE